MEKKTKMQVVDKEENKKVKSQETCEANTCKDEGPVPLMEDENPVAHITKLYEENKFLKQQLHNISRLEIILEVLKIDNWDEQFESILRNEVKKAFGLHDKENNNQE